MTAFWGTSHLVINTIDSGFEAFQEVAFADKTASQVPELNGNALDRSLSNHLHKKEVCIENGWKPCENSTVNNSQQKPFSNKPELLDKILEEKDSSQCSRSKPFPNKAELVDKILEEKDSSEDTQRKKGGLFSYWHNFAK